MKKPRLAITDLISEFCIMLGLLLMLFCLHILSISYSSDISNIIVTLYEIYLRVYMAALLGIVLFNMIQLFRWVTWKVTTPAWEQDKV